MTRNLRLLALMLIAMLALGGMAAQGALANVEHSFTSEVEPTELTGSGGVHEWGLEEGEALLKCGKVALTGFLATISADEINLTPEFSECKFSSKVGTYSVTAKNNGCKTAFDSDTSPNPDTGKKEDGTVSLNCGHSGNLSFEFIREGKKVEILFLDTHPAGVPVNQELHGAKYFLGGPEVGPSDLIIQAHVTRFKFLCIGNCAPVELREGTNDGGTTIGTYTVKGYSDAAHTHQVSIGFSIP